MYLIDLVSLFFIINSPPFVIFEEEEHQDFSVTVGFITRLSGLF